MVRALGRQRAKRLRQRLDDLDSVERFGDVRRLPGRLHELTADLKGKFSMDLDGPYRLILEPVFSEEDDDDPDWAEATTVRVVGIEDTHG